MFFALGAGLGLIMQNVVLAAQNAVPGRPDRHRHLDEQLLPRGRRHPRRRGVRHAVHQPARREPRLARWRATPSRRSQAGITSPDTLVPSAVQAAGEPLKTAIVDAYANSLAPVFWYLVPILAVAFLLSLVLKEIPLSEFAGMVARGEAVNSEEELAALSAPATVEKVVILEDRDDRRPRGLRPRVARSLPVEAPFPARERGLSALSGAWPARMSTLDLRPRRGSTSGRGRHAPGGDVMLEPGSETPVDAADLDGLRARTRTLCARFPDEYWRETRPRPRVPAGVRRRPDRGRAARRADPRRVRRLGLGLTEASVIMEEINRSGGALRRLPRADVHDGRRCCGTAARRRSTPTCRRSPSGELRLQAFSITEAEAGSDTTSISTTARRDGDDYVIDGHKNWTSRIGSPTCCSCSPAPATRRRPDPRAEPVPGRPAPGARRAARGARGHAGAHDVQLRHQRGVLPRTARPGGPRRSARTTPASATSSTAGTPSASCSPPRPSATATGSSSAPPPTPTSARSSAGRSAPTRASSSRSPTPTCRSARPT